MGNRIDSYAWMEGLDERIKWRGKGRGGDVGYMG